MISVCLPTKNAGPQFALNLRAWRQQRTEEEFELVVVDSGSRDATLSTAREFCARLHTIPPQEFNHGETRNLLARQARGDLLVFTVQDARPANEAVLAELTRPLRQQPGLAAVTGKQLPHPDADPVAQWEVHYHNSVLDPAPAWQPPLRNLSGSFLQRLRGLAFDNVCSALHRRVWEQLPFARLDYAEDLDWALRARRAGHSFLRNPAARVYHSHNRQPYQRLKRAFVARRATNRILELAPNLPSLNEEEILSGIGTYAAVLTLLRHQLGAADEPIKQLRLPTSALHPFRRALRRAPLAPVQRLASRLRSRFVPDRLCGDFNAAARPLVSFHGGLARSKARFVTLQLGLQVLGDFLGDFAYAAERQGSVPDWWEELSSYLASGV